jgi:hypothetical protein
MSYFYRAEVLTASSAEEIFCLLSNMKEAQQEAVFSLGTGSSCSSYSFWDPDPAFYRSGSRICHHTKCNFYSLPPSYLKKKKRRHERNKVVSI